jgi:hypothetical protein
LQRILLLSAHLDEDAHDLITELECVREWTPTQHLRWRLRSSRSCRSARISLLCAAAPDKPWIGDSTQYGTGKTRVLVPMLILDLMSSEGLVASHASVDHRRSYGLLQDRSCFICTACETLSLQFQRGIPLDEMRARQLSDEISRCREHLGCVVVTLNTETLCC